MVAIGWQRGQRSRYALCHEERIYSAHSAIGSQLFVVQFHARVGRVQRCGLVPKVAHIYFCIGAKVCRYVPDEMQCSLRAKLYSQE
jgi:hypothetical protein